MEQAFDNTESNLERGDFYREERCCTSCGIPQSIAPDLVGWTNGDASECYWIKQPKTADELDRAIEIVLTQELGCHRYSGADPEILRRLPPQECDHLRPGLKHKSVLHFLSSGQAPDFELSASDRSSVLRRIWRRLRGQ